MCFLLVRAVKAEKIKGGYALPRTRPPHPDRGGGPRPRPAIGTPLRGAPSLDRETASVAQGAPQASSPRARPPAALHRPALRRGGGSQPKSTGSLPQTPRLFLYCSCPSVFAVGWYSQLPGLDHRPCPSARVDSAPASAAAAAAAFLAAFFFLRAFLPAGPIEAAALSPLFTRSLSKESSQKLTKDHKIYS
jgi:hypothetical protein